METAGRRFETLPKTRPIVTSLSGQVVGYNFVILSEKYISLVHSGLSVIVLTWLPQPPEHPR
jgi:hypothetical protein